MDHNDNSAPLVKISSVAPSLLSLGKESILSSQISLFVQNTKPKIPDGGWGWLIVLSAFFINMASDGVSFTFGLLYIEFLNEFGASKSATSWIGSLFMAVPLISGPIMSALVDRYGCRSMTIIGGLISTVGFVLSAHSKSIVFMYVTFGVIGGMGLGLCYVTAVVSIAFWFDNKRSVALGLGACGTGFGTLVYSPLSTFLLKEYGWRGTVLILAGCFLNMCVCGGVMRDPPWISEENWSNNQKSSNSRKSSKFNSKRASTNLEEQNKKPLEGSEQTDEFLLEHLDTSLDLSETKYQSALSLPTFVRENEMVPLEVLKKLKDNKHLYNVILETYPNLLLAKSSSEKGINLLSDGTPAKIPLTLCLKLTQNPKEYSDEIKEVVAPLEEINLLVPKITHVKPHSYLKNMRLQRSSISYRGAMLNINKYKLKASSCPNIYRNSMTTLAKEAEEKWYSELLELLKDITHFSLFLELHFLLMSLSTILLFTWFIIPYFYLADHMLRFGYTENEASFVISIIGITNTIGMVVLGWAGDRTWLNVTKSYAICLGFCGIFCSAMLFFTQNYVMLLVSAGLFGIFFASCFSFIPAILTDLVPLDEFTMAYGLNLLCQGIGNLVGPPLGGLLFDLTNSWDQSFYQAGFWIVISGVLVGIIPYTKNRRIF